MEPRNRTLLSAAILIVLLLIAIVAISREDGVDVDDVEVRAAGSASLDLARHRSPS